ncbi:Uncharacterised protein [Citrobacter koseri]|uniref:Uncharacterized protein n=1 Tax=Citrobacter koseri TaxID=545 RepID=A0A2X2WGI2_CITKO|nr:Uncharacterised protein [Citrobacter koseri]
MSEVIFSFENSSDAARAGMLMNKADPSLRYVHIRATVCVTWHANIIAATPGSPGCKHSVHFSVLE